MPLHHRTTPTLDELQAAYARLAKRDWPSLHELALAAQRYELVLGTALRQARPLPGLGANAAPAHPAQRPPLRRAAPSARQPLPFDHKRAAAGERPDDE